ncbi:MAG: ammonium transporter [Mycobacteriales bacterium]
MSVHLIGLAAAAPEPIGDSALTSANTAWILASSALVLLMTPGLAFFYGGMTRAKSTLNMIMMSFSAIGIVSVIWVIYGYTLAFAPDAKGGLIGNLSIRFLHNESQASITNHLYDYGFIAFQLMFAIITLALISGAVADRMKFSAWIAFSIVWISLVYFPVAHWVFDFGVPAPTDASGAFTGKVGNGNAYGFVAGTGGWIASKLGALDFAGGTAVHINAGAAGLALCLVLGVRKGFGKDAMRPHNLPLVMIGTGMLWFGWFGFNAGSALLANGLAGLAFVNTQVATAAALCGWLIVERIRDGHFTTLGAASGAVAGLVAITPACGAVSPSGAIALGGVAGAVCCLAISLKNRFGFDDALDVVGVHLVGGLVGTLLIGFLATSASTGVKSLRGVFYGGGFSQLGKQAIAAFSVMGYSFVLTLVIALVIKYTMGLRVTEEQEVTGIDQTIHAESAYEFAGLGSAGSGTLAGALTAPEQMKVNS